jgi:FtsP/CotA-like multicopper oxidase with cupredoxin domain
MVIGKFRQVLLFSSLVCIVSLAAFGQSFRVQCPATTSIHPTVLPSGSPEPAFTGPVATTATYTPVAGGTPLTIPFINNGGAIKCQQVSGGDGYMTEADGNQTFMFAFGPLSGLGLIKQGLPGTVLAADFNVPYADGPNYLNGQPNPYYGTAGATANGGITDPAGIMNTGVMNGNIPAPLIAIDEDDELFLTLTNVGMIMRPDLFEQHTIHFHGYPNASAYYDGVPDASIAINIGGSFTYYYLAPDAGTYFWHCHITPPEHLQMGMVGQLYVRPRQNRVAAGTSLYSALQLQQTDLRTACPTAAVGQPNVDILCSAPLPAVNTGATQGLDKLSNPQKYAYNDGDGTTAYDIDVPIQIHGFDPNFHFVGMTFNPEGFADMKDKYFLLNGRSYPDTVNTTGNWQSGFSSPQTSSIYTEDSDGQSRPSQPLNTLITLKQGQKALLRISDLDVTEYQTLASMGIPMKIVGYNAKLLRDQAGNNLYYTTNSITLAGGESLDAILDSTGVAPGTYFLYTPQLDHLSNDAENFGGLMTEVVVTN